MEESLGKKLAQVLAEEGLKVITHVDNPTLPRGIDDTEWAQRAGSSGWVTISKDLATRYKPNEREAIVRAGARVFQFTGGNWTSAEMAAAFIAAKNRVARLLKGQPGPFIARINKKGEITKVFTAADLSGPSRIADDRPEPPARRIVM
ncbi:MAG TPA: hypothetical protein VGT02_17530 [Methylomirabilota bacterium]|nr:hypothetical protein [Methylomirabilota bacterium]